MPFRTHAPRSSFSSLCLWLTVLAAACHTRTPLIRQAVQLNARGATQLTTGDLDGARASFEVALEYNDRFAEPHNNLGLVALSQLHPREARRHFRAAIDCNRDFAEAFNNLGVALSQCEGSADDECGWGPALAAWRDALSVHPGFEDARVNLVRALLELGRVSEALEQARRLAQVAPRNAMAHTLRSAAASRAGEDSEALIAARVAVRLSPEDPDAQWVMARALVALRRAEEARPWLDRLLRSPRHAEGARTLRTALDRAAR